jgi:CBS domain-containing protein
MKNIRLLIVDDDEDYMILLRGILKDSDLPFEIDEVNSSKSALAKLGENSYDCVIIDYLIPGVSGLEVMKKARSLGIKTPFILFTAFGGPELAEELIKQGASDFISKDELNRDVLQYKINAVVSEELPDEIQLEDAPIAKQTIGELMVSPPQSIDSAKTIDEVIEQLNSYGVGSLLVKKDGTYAGIVTKSDLIRKAISQKLPKNSTKVSAVMTTPILALASETSAKEAYEFMKNKHIRHLAVTKDNSIVGVVSVNSLTKNNS